MNIGKGIAVAGIWIGVGLCGLGGIGSEGCVLIALCAFGATAIIFI